MNFNQMLDEMLARVEDVKQAVKNKDLKAVAYSAGSVKAISEVLRDSAMNPNEDDL